MAPIPWQQAKNLLVVDPFTGRQVPHVAAADPDEGWIKVYKTTGSPKDFGMIMNGEMKSYTVLVAADFAGGREAICAREYGAYELVDKNTGEVVREVGGLALRPRVTDPEAYWKENPCG